MGNFFSSQREQPRLLLNVGTLTFDELLAAVDDLNLRTPALTDRNGKHLTFRVLPCGEEKALHKIFWKLNVRIECNVVRGQESSSHKLLGLREFCRLHHTVLEQAQIPDQRRNTSSSTFLGRFTGDAVVPLQDECPICLDRRADLVLTCAHSFCTSCLASWRRENPTCPMCRCGLDDEADRWELTQTPASGDILSYLSGCEED